jgi:hypothetical protein
MEKSNPLLQRRPGASGLVIASPKEKIAPAPGVAGVGGFDSSAQNSGLMLPVAQV